MPLQKGNRALRIHQAQAHLAVAVFQTGQPFDRLLQIPLALFKNQFAHLFELAMDILEDIGQIFQLLLKNGDEKVVRRIGFDLAAPGAHAQQAKIGRILFAQGNQPVRLQDEGDGDRLVPSLGHGKKKGMDVQSCAVNEVAGGSFDLLDIFRFRQFGAQVLLELIPFRFGRVENIDPVGMRQDCCHFLGRETDFGNFIILKIENSEHGDSRQVGNFAGELTDGGKVIECTLGVNRY